MKSENAYYEVSPKIVPTDRKSRITIRPLYGHSRFDDRGKYEVVFIPMDQSIEPGNVEEYPKQILKPVDNTLVITYAFEKEQEYVLYIRQIGDNGRKEVGAFSVYSLQDDLFNRMPYKGDLHLHSYYSDGRESPAYVAAACRRIGFDFMAITDHHKYAPSLEAQDAYAELEVDLKIFPGEEVHPPQNHVHIVNFGGSFSINQLFEDEQRYRKEVKQIADSIKDIPPYINKYEYCSCVWCFDKIRAGGGLGIFCHPFWVTNRYYHVAPEFTLYMFEKRPFDAFELLGGHEVDSNTLQVAFYNEERAKGRKIPIVGVSDAHGCEHGEFFGWFYTIVFSPNLRLEGIIGSIKDLYSVAVEALPGESIRVYGPYRLVKYALFLIREVFPKHDELCYQEGQLMLRAVSGDEEAKEILKRMKGQTVSLMNRYWGFKSV